MKTPAEMTIAVAWAWAENAAAAPAIARYETAKLAEFAAQMAAEWKAAAESTAVAAAAARDAQHPATSPDSPQQEASPTRVIGLGDGEGAA